MEPNYPPVDSVPPPVPRGRLWASLLVPPVVVGGGWILAAVISPHLGKILPRSLSWMWSLVVLAGLAICLMVFIDFIRLMDKRYSGTSLALLIIGYLIGEAVVCLAVFFGACLYSFNL